MAKHILVIDDQESMCNMVGQMLRGAGFKVTSALNGAEGLKIFEESPGSFHLILSDVNMPGLDGFELLKKVKASHPAMPVVLLSGINEGVLEMGSKEYGAEGVIFKPFQINEALKVINQALSS